MSKRKTHEQFLQEMLILHPNIRVKSEYVKAKEKVKLECLIDGYEWEATPNKLINSKHGCPKCGGSLP